jgi:hypothetical protein
MKFLIDANLPRRMVRIFQERGHDASIHWIYPKATQQQMPRFGIMRMKITAPLQPKILISVHPSGFKTVPTDYY